MHPFIYIVPRYNQRIPLSPQSAEAHRVQSLIVYLVSILSRISLLC
jgi:hypothetical protein